MSAVAHHSSRNILISGGAGCIGTNLAAHLLATTTACITVLYDPARPGADRNLGWLAARAEPGRMAMEAVDGGGAMGVDDADEIYDLAHCGHSRDAQARERNDRRTRELLEAARRSSRNPVVIFASMPSEHASKTASLPLLRAEAPEAAANPGGAPSQSLEQLVQDFAHIYGVPAVVLRFEAVAGARQFDQNGDWLAKTVYSILENRPVAPPPGLRPTQDILHVADAVDAMLAARAYVGITAGKAYDVGGGSARALSFPDLVRLVERTCSCSARLASETAQDAALAPVAKTWPFRVDTGWRARRSVEEAIREMAAFWKAEAGESQPRAVPVPFPYTQAA